MDFLAKNYERLKWMLTPAAEKKRVLDQAIAYLRGYGVTRELLDLAAAENIPISFNLALIGTEVNGRLVDTLKTGKRTLELKPSEDAGRVASTLIHELRHVWQKKVLGISQGDIGATDADARTSLLMTRVMEADAYAFTRVVTRRMVVMEKVGRDLIKAAQNQAQRTGKPAPDNAQANKMLAQFRADLPIRPEKMKSELAKEFQYFLKKLGDYDLRTVERYHSFFTSPGFTPLKHSTQPDGHKIGLQDARKILTGKDGLSYLGPLDDKTLCQLVLGDVAPEILKAADLMTTFEKAASRGLPTNDNAKLRQLIDKNIKTLKTRPAGP